MVAGERGWRETTKEIGLRRRRCASFIGSPATGGVNPKGRSLLRIIDYEASRLLPAYFSLVMATGIVSIAAFLYGLKDFAYLLLGFNVLASISLWALTALRIVRHRSAFLDDMKDLYRGSGFFTLIAATNTLGSQLVVILHDFAAGYYIWICGLMLWFFFQYGLFSIFTVEENKPPIEKGLSGTWLVAIVSTQSVAVLGAQLSPVYPQTYIVALVMYMIGWLTYPLIMSMVSYRLLFFRIQPSELTGPYWINMGATAITTLAGSQLLLNLAKLPIADSLPFVNAIQGFIEGATFLIWAYGTWWIPWLLIIGFWRHVLKRVSLLKYEPAFWSAVFPLGMYTVSTYALVQVTGLGMLRVIPDCFVYVAIVAWGYQFASFVYALASKMKKEEATTP